MNDSKINAFQTAHIINLIQNDPVFIEKYQAWMMIPLAVPRESSVNRAKRVIGKQDYCWTGSCRNYIWERPFPFVVDGVLWPRHWRLFASKRGLSFEVEISEVEDHSNVNLGRAALAHFLSYWKSGDL